MQKWLHNSQSWKEFTKQEDKSNKQHIRETWTW